MSLRDILAPYEIQNKLVYNRVAKRVLKYVAANADVTEGICDKKDMDNLTYWAQRLNIGALIESELEKEHKLSEQRDRKRKRVDDEKRRIGDERRRVEDEKGRREGCKEAKDIIRSHLRKLVLSLNYSSDDLNEYFKRLDICINCEAPIRLCECTE